MKMYTAGDAELCVLLTVAQSVTPILCRAQAYERLFTFENTQKAHLETLEAVAVEIYGACFQVLAHTCRELESKVRRARHALLEPGKATDLISKLKELEFEHDRAVNLCHKSSTLESNQRVEAVLDQLKACLESNEMVFKRVEANVDSLVVTDRQKRLNWISDVQFTDDHNSVKDKRAKNTGTWLLRHGKFTNWEDSDSSSLFWLKGTGESQTPLIVSDRPEMLTSWSRNR
jgi:hypothetical protein